MHSDAYCGCSFYAAFPCSWMSVQCWHDLWQMCLRGDSMLCPFAIGDIAFFALMITFACDPLVCLAMDNVSVIRYGDCTRGCLLCIITFLHDMSVEDAFYASRECWLVLFLDMDHVFTTCGIATIPDLLRV